MLTDIGKAFNENLFKSSPRFGFTAIHERPSFTTCVSNALNHHTHYYTVKEQDKGNAQFRYVEMTCGCGDKVRLFIPPEGQTMACLAEYVNTGYETENVPDNG